MNVNQRSAEKPRLAFLDMTKGILVLLMVIYHTLNYTSHYHLGFRYLSFLPPSFIFITGFLISHVYTLRYPVGGWVTVRRPLVRSAKLLVLFTALNVVAHFVRSPVYGQPLELLEFFQRWLQIFIVGSERAAVFEVLLPIAYLLLLAPPIMSVAHGSRIFLPVLTFSLVAGCVYLERAGLVLINLNLISAGVLGMCIGQLLPHPTNIGRFFWLALAIYCMYWPLSVARGYVYIVQLLGACIALAFICGLSIRAGHRGWWQQSIIRLGQYSLMAYIVQIGVLQLLSRYAGRPDPLSLTGTGLFFTTLVLTLLSVEFTAWVRDRYTSAESLYKAVFA